MGTVIEAERIMLKVFEPADLDDMKQVWGNDEVMKYCLGATPHESLPMVLHFYQKCHEEKGLSVYAVVEKETGRVIGAAGFNVKDSVDLVELIYHIAKDKWGMGYATEAVKACLQFAKESGKVKTIFASAHPQNAQSFKILEKIGFAYKGLKWFEDTKQNEPYYELNLHS